MQRRSKGPFVAAILCYLAVWHYRTFGVPMPGLVVDEDYLDVGCELMRIFQRHKGLDDDAGFGTDTRGAFEKEFQISVASIAHAFTTPTMFVQLDETVVEWRPAEGQAATA